MTTRRQRTIDLLLVGASQVVTLDDGGKGPKAGAEAMNDLGVLENAGVAVHRGKIVDVGPSLDLARRYRAYRREVLEAVPYHRNSDDFVFDSEFLVQVAALGYRIADVPVPCRYFDEASQIRFRESVKYGLATLAVLGAYGLHRLGVRTDHRFSARKPNV